MNSGNLADPQAKAVESVSRMIDIGGRRLAMTSSGQGSPTVILETGLGAESAEWEPIQREIAKLTRVVRYDRARRGASDPVDGPRSASDMVSDLHQMLRIADIGGPYLLVGHSYGGLLVRLYAQRYPDDVAGVVLVDSMHEDQFDIFGPKIPPATPGEAASFTEMRAFWQGGWRNPDATTERIDMVESIRQGKAITSLGATPLHVIMAGTMLNNPTVPPHFRAPLQNMFEERQMDFTKLSSRSTHSQVLSSGHFVQRDAPQAVIDAIKTMLTSIGGR